MARRSGGKIRLVRCLAIALLALAPFGARMSMAGEAEPPATVETLHEVVPGDNLHLIAGYYYGDARQWERIWQANRPQVRNPNRIEKGMLLRVPTSTVPSEPYGDFVARVRRSATRASAP